MLSVVLGAAGFIGTALTRRLLAEGHDVRVVDRVIPDMPYRREVWDAAESMVCDLRNLVAAWDAVADADWVFHLAADVGGVGYLARNDYLPFFNNMQMSMNVLQACESRQVGRLFYASSSCVYPVTLQEADHWSALEEVRDIEHGYPDLMYGREKLMTLRLCERAPFDARVGIVNTAFGPGLKLSGERMKYPAAVTVRAIDAVKQGVPLDIWGDGSQVRGYLHVDDAVEKMWRIMSDPYAGPVNITSKEVASCTHVARMVLDILGADVPLRYVDGPTGPAHRVVSNRKWEQTYGPDGQRTMRAAYEDFVPWVQANL